MKYSRLYIFLLVSFLLLSLSGCVKEDNLYPDLNNTSWYAGEGSNKTWISFKDKEVVHLYGSDTIYSGIYRKGCTYGINYYCWTDSIHHKEYKVCSYGHAHLMMSVDVAYDTLDPYEPNMVVIPIDYYLTKE